jgi:hypothetical protein
MDTAFWESVAAKGRKIPHERPLADLTIELTMMLGDQDPYIRSHLAATTLLDWIEQGVYDELLGALGDGMTAGLANGLGDRDDDSVFRRASSAQVLAACIRRENDHSLLAPDTLHRWGDAVMSWIVREEDLRGYIPGKGWARALTQGADALTELARSTTMGLLELTVLLDVIADRLTAKTGHFLDHGEIDRLVVTTLTALRREVVGMNVLEPWVARLRESSKRLNLGGDPYLVTANVQAYLRALFVALTVTAQTPSVRGDLMLVLLDTLRTTNSDF